jgi:hypothetical protein
MRLWMYGLAYTCLCTLGHTLAYTLLAYTLLAYTLLAYTLLAYTHLPIHTCLYTLAYTLHLAYALACGWGFHGILL